MFPVLITRRPRRILFSAVATVLVLSCAAPALGAPTNAKIEAAREKADEARDRIDEISADLEELTEDYLEIEDALQHTREQIGATERELTAAQMELDAAEMRLNGRAATIYRNGPVDLIAVFVGVTDFQDFVTRLDLMRRVGSNDAAIVDDVKGARERLEKARVSLESRRAEQTALRQQAGAKRARVEETLAAQKEYLAGIDATLKKLIAQERERQERLARQRAEEARLAAARARRAPGRDFDPSRLGEPHPGVVAVARRFVGKTPYVWGGTTTTGFDCSGLTQYCYRELGISIPRTSRQQFRWGAYIPPDRLDLLRPGDLVFFGRDGDPGRVHHVAIFIGGGNMIHAPETGRMVSVDSLMARIARRGDYVGATRP